MESAWHIERPTRLPSATLDVGLLTERQVQDVWSSFGSRNVPPDEFIQSLVRRELLTNYQVERLLERRAHRLFLRQLQRPVHGGSRYLRPRVSRVHRETGKVVALKVLRKRFSDNQCAGQPDSFAKDRWGASSATPTSCPSTKWSPSGTIHFIVMEFVEGRNLREFVRIRKKLDPVEATRLMIGITDGLRYAFEHGMTHRDLKLSNVLVSSRGKRKLVDFGLASMDETLSDDALMNLPTRGRSTMPPWNGRPACGKTTREATSISSAASTTTC